VGGREGGREGHRGFGEGWPGRGGGDESEHSDNLILSQ